MKILVINPGSTSTKLALFEDERELWTETIGYSEERLAPFTHVADQLEMRVSDVCTLLAEKGVRSAKEIDAIAARGGLMAAELSKDGDIPAFITDPVTVDELIPEARLSPNEIRSILVGRGGFVSHLGTNSLREIEERIDRGDEEAALVHRAFVYQCSKEIASLSAALSGNIDGIVVAGGMAHSVRTISAIRERVGFLAPFFVHPGEMEMEALAEGALRALDDAMPTPHTVL